MSIILVDTFGGLTILVFSAGTFDHHENVAHIKTDLWCCTVSPGISVELECIFSIRR